MGKQLGCILPPKFLREDSFEGGMVVGVVKDFLIPPGTLVVLAIERS